VHEAAEPAFPPFEVIVHRRKGWWIIDLPDIGHQTRASTLAAVTPTAQVALAQRLHIKPESVPLDLRVMPNRR